MNMASSCKTTDYTLHFSFRKRQAYNNIAVVLNFERLYDETPDLGLRL